MYKQPGARTATKPTMIQSLFNYSPESLPKSLYLISACSSGTTLWSASDGGAGDGD